MDHSASMTDTLSYMNSAAIRFLERRNPQDKFFMVSVDDHVENITSAEELKAQLERTTARGHTALLDGMYLALVQLEQAHNAKKVLLILSDGGDNQSRYTEREVRDLVKESGTQVYALLPTESIGYRATMEEQDRPQFLESLCKSSGGRAIAVKDRKGLPVAAELAAMQIRREYVLGYVLPRSESGKRRWRAVSVKVKQRKGWPTLTVNTRDGYFYAPNH